MSKSNVTAAMVQGDNVVLIVDGKVHTANRHTIATASYDKLVSAVKCGNWDEAARLLDAETAIHDFGGGKLQLQGGVVMYEGRKMNSALSKRMLGMLREGTTVDALVNFIDNLMLNPSLRAVEELYGFLEKNNLPLTPDGHFLAYKKVNKDYTDIHTGQFSNAVGNTLKMTRNAVDDDYRNHCSHGLHFASLEYMPHFGARTSEDAHVMILKINPRDVVSIPSDYNNQKGRCCEYTVIGEHNVEKAVSGVEAFNVTVVTPTVESTNVIDTSAPSA